MNNIQRVIPARVLSREPPISALIICRRCLHKQYRNARPRFYPIARRAASTDSSKPIILEQPDKFRPPSHPARLNRPRRSPAAYNQGSTAEERQQQRSKSYPHTFPNEGTFMHWFLTNRRIHLWITVGTLTILASITTVQSFIRTSPYSHLIPPISSLPLHPIAYITEGLSVLRLHIEYQTQRTNESRQQNILDAQKRRLYRRAHGMEDLNAAEEQGIDVRGLVPWDDGLTNLEREQGGRDLDKLSMGDMMRLGMEEGEKPAEFMKKLHEQGRLHKIRTQGVDATLKAEEEEARTAARNAAIAMEESVAREQAQPPPPEKRMRKLYFGIW